MKENAETKMERRRIVLKDGRYLIFYTFAEAEEISSNENEDSDESQREA